MHSGCSDSSIGYEEVQLTSSFSGHCINSTQCFSPDGSKLVYDTRNDDSQLAANGEIRVLDIRTGEDNLAYKTINQSEYGPGVGAATWSPDGKMLLFLGGIQNADKDRPYSFTRRMGIGIAVDQLLTPIWMDARDIVAPFTPGALRGGTHAHTWSGDSDWISFTYNDYVLGETAKTDSTVIDTRTVGIMFPGEVNLTHADNIENKNGRMFSVLISRVVKDAQPGSDEIMKAFDECWIGVNGYSKPDGKLQKRAIAFQGNVIDKTGKIKTEIFVADIPDTLPDNRDLPGLTGTNKTLPVVPASILQRRITFTEKGISAVPRHWLRSVPNGSLIGFLATDENNIVQLWGVSPNGGEIKQITRLKASISGAFNFSPDGKFVAYTSDGTIFITQLSNSKTIAVSERDSPDRQLVGAPVWSPNGKEICFNRYIGNLENRFLQVFLVKLNGVLSQL